MMQKVLRWTWILVILAALYAGWRLWSRQREQRAAEQAAKDAEAERDAAIVQRMGGNRLKILAFYSTPGLVCYGVSNAASVKIEPFIDETKPSLSRCLEIHPKKATTYTLTATDQSGHSETATVTVSPHE